MKIAVEPRNHRHELLCEAVSAGGGEVSEPSQASGLIWCDTKPGRLSELLHDGIDWVQLPWAGIEPFIGSLDDKRRWTCGKGIYAQPVAEHVLALTLACLHNLHNYARASSWAPPVGANLHARDVLIIGGGGICETLLPLLQPFQTHNTVIRRNPQPMPGAQQCLGMQHLHAELEKADIVVLALALTAETQGLIGVEELRRMKPSACLINVARGAHIDTDALASALAQDEIAAAALDVTQPEPLPEGHALWSQPRCLITPHVGNTPEMGIALLRQHIKENTRRYIAGEELLSPVDVAAGY